MKLKSGPVERTKFRVGGAIDDVESTEVRLEEVIELPRLLREAT